MRIYLDIRDDIKPETALECVKQVVEAGKISNDGKSYCWLTTFSDGKEELIVCTRPYRKNTCFAIYKEHRNEN